MRSRLLPLATMVVIAVFAATIGPTLGFALDLFFDASTQVVRGNSDEQPRQSHDGSAFFLFAFETDVDTVEDGSSSGIPQGTDRLQRGHFGKAGLFTGHSPCEGSGVPLYCLLEVYRI